MQKAMKYTYKIDLEDLLTFQLYTASKSEVVEKKRRNGRFILMLASIAFSGYFFTQNEVALGTYFAIMVVLTFFFYGKYFLWKHKLNYRRFIKANYSSRFGMEETLETFPDRIHVKDNLGEGDVKRSEFESVAETGDYFFLQLAVGTSLVVPKAQINPADFKKDLLRLKIPFVEDLNWSWS